MSSTIHLDDFDILNPYDTILQYAGSRLRHVSLKSARDYPLILRHLTDHCPHLQTLSVSSSNIVRFPSMRQRLAGLLPRLNYFQVSHFWDRDSETRKISYVSQIFEHVENSLKLERLSLLQGPVSPEEVPKLKFILSKLPRIADLNASVDIDHWDLFLDHTNLKRVRIRLPRPMLAGEFIPLLRLITAGRPDLEIEFETPGKRLSLVALFGYCGIVGVEMLDALLDAGITAKISAQDIIPSILDRRRNFTIDKLEQFLRIIASNEHPLLPSRESLASLLLSNIDVLDQPIEVIEQILETFGRYNFDRQMLAFAVMSHSVEKIEFFVNAGCLGLDDFTLVDDSGSSVFSVATHKEAVSWLLESLSPETARLLLRQKPLNSSHCAAVQLINFPDIVEVIVASLGDDVFAFPEENDLLRVLDLCAAKDVDALKLILEATGVSNISAVSQGAVLWHLCGDRTGKVLDYWLEQLKSNQNSEEPSLFQDKLHWALGENNEGTERNVIRVLHQYADTLLRQLQQIPDVEDYLMFMVKWISHAKGGSSPLAEKIFTAMARRCSSIGIPTLKFVSPLIYFKHETNDDILEALLDVCIEADFDYPELPSHPAQIAFLEQVAAFLDSEFKSPKAYGFKILGRCLSKLDCLETCDQSLLNRIMDSVLQQSNAGICDGIGDLIERMVRRGFRISHPDRKSQFCTRLANTEALELYFEAVHLHGDTKL
jgi:hypothetical protein